MAVAANTLSLLAYGKNYGRKQCHSTGCRVSATKKKKRFIKWIPGPQCLSWLLVLHRIANAETSRHAVTCGNCGKQVPMSQNFYSLLSSIFSLVECLRVRQTIYSRTEQSLIYSPGACTIKTLRIRNLRTQ
jgi:hypothetical protein